MRKWGVVLAVLGVLMVAGAALLRFVVVPSGQQLPADTDEKIQYAGTLTAIDPAALTSGAEGAAAPQEVAVTVDRRLRVLETEGDRARVVDSSVIKAVDSGETVSEREYVYAIDRQTLMAAPNFSDEPVEDAEGLVVGFPIGSEKINYVGWVQEAEDTAHVKYQGEDVIRGTTVYKYGGEFSGEPAADQLPGAPTTLPKDQLAGLLEAVDAPDDLREQLDAALPLLPDEIELAYTYTTADSYTVEPTTGIIVDLSKVSTIAVGMAGVPDVSFPLVESTVGYTPRNVAHEVERAQDALDQITLYGTTIPLVLLGLGVVSLAVSVPMMRHRRRTEPPPPSAAPRPPAMSV
jgi:hypothetical protein